MRKAAGFGFVGSEPEFTGYSVEAKLADPDALALGRTYTANDMYTYAKPGVSRPYSRRHKPRRCVRLQNVGINALVIFEMSEPLAHVVSCRDLGRHRRLSCTTGPNCVRPRKVERPRSNYIQSFKEVLARCAAAPALAFHRKRIEGACGDRRKLQ